MKPCSLAKRRLAPLGAACCAICLGATLLAGCATVSETAEPTPALAPASDAIVPRPLPENRVSQNPYLSSEEAMIHNDVYNSDVTAKAMPLGIHPELAEGEALDSPNSPPAFFYDNDGNAVAPYSMLRDDGTVLGGGIAIRDMDSENLDVEGCFMPALHDEGGRYGIQISYSFVDKENLLVGPATNGHVVIIRTTDDAGNVLPVFQKVLDVDVVSGAVAALGEDIDRNLLSVVYDYDGNLWFVTGGFHKNPAYSEAGFWGYLDREYIDRTIAGEQGLDPAAFLHYAKLQDGENAENGIAAHEEGCVILTNKACYLLEASESEGVVQRWSVPCESSGGKAAQEDGPLTGAGLAWGGGSSPTLTDDLALFTDNKDVVNLFAVDIATGEVVASAPVLDLGPDVIVSVENSLSVYAPDSERTSVLVCNWYGAGNAGLFAADADSSVQSYDNLYDDSWRAEGSSRLMPGVERIDVVRAPDGSYEMQQVWQRADLKDTSMIKLSTAAGYYYGYTQDEDTGEWGFFALDYDTGETVFWQPVSADPAYNNIAVGIMQGDGGNTMYCPTNSPALVRMQDRIAYLPDAPDERLDLAKMQRRVLDAEAFEARAGVRAEPASYLLSAAVPAEHAGSAVAFRVNGLSGARGDFAVYAGSGAEAPLAEVADAVVVDETGREVGERETLVPEAVYEIRLPGEGLIDPATGSVSVVVVAR